MELPDSHILNITNIMNEISENMICEETNNKQSKKNVKFGGVQILNEQQPHPQPQPNSMSFGFGGSDVQNSNFMQRPQESTPFSFGFNFVPPEVKPVVGCCGGITYHETPNTGFTFAPSTKVERHPETGLPLNQPSRPFGVGGLQPVGTIPNLFGKVQQTPKPTHGIFGKPIQERQILNDRCFPTPTHLYQQQVQQSPYTKLPKSEYGLEQNIQNQKINQLKLISNELYKISAQNEKIIMLNEQLILQKEQVVKSTEKLYEMITSFINN